MDGQRRLRNARVLSVGAGGLGSAVLQYLAAAGVGVLGVIDDDVVETSNLQRQVVHGEADVGRLKTESAADTINRLNSDVVVRRHAERLSARNAIDLVSEYDLVLDGSDNFSTRYLVNDACAIAGIPYVWGSILGFEGQVSVFWQDAPSGGRTYRDLHPQAPAPGAVPSCAEAGVLGALCGVVGSLMATEALKLVMGIGQVLLGRVLIIDLLNVRLREVAFAPSGGPRITTLAAEPTQTPAQTQGADATLPTIAPGELAEAIDHERLRVIDVREPWEVDIVRIDGSSSVPLETFLGDPTAFVGDLPAVIYCKSGARSATALQAALDAGVRDVRHLSGGVLAWVEQVRPELPKY